MTKFGNGARLAALERHTRFDRSASNPRESIRCTKCILIFEKTMSCVLLVKTFTDLIIRIF